MLDWIRVVQHMHGAVQNGPDLALTGRNLSHISTHAFCGAPASDIPAVGLQRVPLVLRLMVHVRLSPFSSDLQTRWWTQPALKTQKQSSRADQRRLDR